MTDTLETFTDANFDAEVLRSELPVLVDFAADWCQPCVAFEPILEQVAGTYAGKVRVGKSDVDRNAEIATRYAIHHLPTVLVFRGGKVIGQVIGAVPRHKLDALVTAVLL